MGLLIKYTLVCFHLFSFVHLNIQLFALKMSETAQVSSLPLPPMQYVTLFSEENMKRGRTPRPPPPITDAYSMFGNPYHTDDAVIRPLESQNIRRLYPNNYDHRRELKKLNHSITASFLDLVDIIIRNPESEARAAKIDDLTLLFIHMHHLVNEFRPHQARETLRVMLEQQKQERLDVVSQFMNHVERAQEILRVATSVMIDEARPEAVDVKPSLPIADSSRPR